MGAVPPLLPRPWMRSAPRGPPCCMLRPPAAAHPCCRQAGVPHPSAAVFLRMLLGAVLAAARVILGLLLAPPCCDLHPPTHPLAVLCAGACRVGPAAGARVGGGSPRACRAHAPAPGGVAEGRGPAAGSHRCGCLLQHCLLVDWRAGGQRDRRGPPGCSQSFFTGPPPPPPPPPPPSCLPAALSPAAARRAWLTAVTTDGLTPAAFAQLAAQPPVQAPPAEASRGGGLGVAPQEEEEREGAEEWWEEGEGQQYPGTPGLAVPASPTRAPLTATPRRAGTVPAPTTPVL